MIIRNDGAGEKYSNGGYKLFHFIVFLFFRFFSLGKILSNYNCINKVF
jgi:hypothetical protein